jgi:tetratricopeptide (TPR) repeat protein/transcriptional regulator with XRE-family HTH domain
MPETGQETFAEALRTLRGALSLRELGRRSSCSKTQINDLENERRRPTPQVAASLDRVLHAGGRLLRLATGPQPGDDGSTGDGVPGTVDDLFREWGDVRRRDFLISSATAGGVALVPGLATDDRPGGGADLMAAHLALRAAHGRLDNLRGASAVYASAVEHHRQVLAWHATAGRSTQQRQTAALAADTGGFVGFLTYDLGMADTAASYYREAAEHAQEAGDLASCANLLGQMSRILAGQGHHRPALDLADKALDLAGHRAHPAVRSWLRAVRAYHHGCLGDARAASTDLNRAWTLLEHADDGDKPTYIGYLSAAELGKWTGHTLTRLGTDTPSLFRRSRIALDEARVAWPTAIVRGSAEVLTASAHAYAASGEPEAAAGLMSQAVAVATATGSSRNLQAALRVQALLARTA